MRKLTFNEKRVIGGVLLVLCIFVVMNYYFINLFGRFDKEAMIICFVTTGAFAHFGVSVQEIRDYRDSQQKK